MKIEALREAYQSNKVVKSICDHMATLDNNRSETAVHRILRLLENDGFDFRKSEIIAAFRALEEADCGKYLRGHPNTSKSRFAWSVRSKFIAGIAQGLKEEIEEELSGWNSDFDLIEEAESDMLEHSYVLRKELTVTFELPPDLTSSEAYRLSQFIGSLSFEG